jgi:hypothetical protein
VHRAVPTTKQCTHSMNHVISLNGVLQFKCNGLPIEGGYEFRGVDCDIFSKGF